MSEAREHLYTQKLYPTVNNDDLLEFRVPANSRGQLDLGNVKLHFKAHLDIPLNVGDKIVPQNFLFRNLITLSFLYKSVVNKRKNSQIQLKVDS